MSLSAEDREELFGLLRATGEVLLKHWKRPRAGEGALAVYEKSDGTKVTEADLEANELLVQGLRKIFPAAGIISEEMPIDEREREKENVIITDPLDGTRSFIAEKDDFSVLVGCAQKDLIQWGAMYFPAKGVEAFGALGAGATISGRVAKVSGATSLANRTLFLSKCELPGSDLPITEWMDSGMALLALAEGVLLGVVIRMVTHQEWDLAAPQAILREAGGLMTDEFGQEIKFNQPKINYRYLVASNGKVHKELLRLVEEMDRRTVGQ